jgi:hypothetical protein
MKISVVVSAFAVAAFSFSTVADVSAKNSMPSSHSSGTKGEPTAATTTVQTPLSDYEKMQNSIAEMAAMRKMADDARAETAELLAMQKQSEEIRKETAAHQKMIEEMKKTQAQMNSAVHSKPVVAKPPKKKKKK